MADPRISARKWNSRLKAATTEIREGVDAVTENPALAAAAASEKWVNRVSESRARFEAGLSRVTLEDWKQATIDKGIPRIAAGADAAVSDVEQFQTELMAFQEGIDRELSGMPDVTLEDSIARATHQMRRMSEFHRRA